MRESDAHFIFCRVFYSTILYIFDWFLNTPLFSETGLINPSKTMLRSNRNKKTLGEADQQQLMEMLIGYGRYWKTTQK